MVSMNLFVGQQWRREIQRHLLLGGKAMTNLDSILKSRDITLPTKVHLIKAMVFPVVMYGCESWTIKKVECWRIDAFELWCWRLLRVPWTARRFKQSILKEISPEYSLEELMLKLKLQYFGYLMWRTDSLEKSLMLGDIEGGRRRGLQRMRWSDGITNQWTWVCIGSGSWWWQGSLACCSPWGHKESDMTEWLNWTELGLQILLILTEISHLPVYLSTWTYMGRFKILRPIWLVLVLCFTWIFRTKTFTLISHFCLEQSQFSTLFFQLFKHTIYSGFW